MGKCVFGVLVCNGSLFVIYVLLLGWFGEMGVVLEGVCFVDCDNLLELFGYVCWDVLLGYWMECVEYMLVVINLVNWYYYVSVIGVI